MASPVSFQPGALTGFVPYRAWPDRGRGRLPASAAPLGLAMPDRRSLRDAR